QPAVDGDVVGGRAPRDAAQQSGCALGGLRAAAVVVWVGFLSARGFEARASSRPTLTRGRRRGLGRCRWRGGGRRGTRRASWRRRACGRWRGVVGGGRGTRVARRRRCWRWRGGRGCFGR